MRSRESRGGCADKNPDSARPGDWTKSFGLAVAWQSLQDAPCAYPSPTGGPSPRHSSVGDPSAIFSSNHSQSDAPDALNPPPRFTMAKICQSSGAFSLCVVFTIIVPTGNVFWPALGFLFTYATRCPMSCTVVPEPEPSSSLDHERKHRKSRSTAMKLEPSATLPGGVLPAHVA